MSAAEFIERFKALPAEERSRVARYVVENDDSWIPQAFKAGISEPVRFRIDQSPITNH